MVDIPEVLRIYSAGKARTVFVGMLKLVPLVVFGTTIIIYGYAAFKNPKEVLENLSIGS